MAQLHCWFPLVAKTWAVVSHHFSIMLVVSSWIFLSSGSFPFFIQMSIWTITLKRITTAHNIDVKW